MKKAAPFFVILAGLLWGSMGLFVRRLNAMGLSSMEIVELRCFLAALILIPFTFIKDRKLLALKPKNLLPLLASSIFSILFFYYCYSRTITLMDMATAAVLLYTAPIFVMLMSALLFREKLTGRKIISLALAFGGCALVCGVGSGSASLSTAGILLGLGSGFGYALYSIFSRVSLNQGLSSITITVYTFLFAAVFGTFLTDFSLVSAAFSANGIFLLFFMLIFTLITTVLSYLLYTTGLRYVETGAASIMASIEPVAAAVLGFLVYGEMPTLPGFIGMLMVLGALLLLNLPERKKEASDAV